MAIELELEDEANNIKVDYAGEKAEIDFDENKISEKKIKEKIISLGYKVD
jgi:copper chaperone CopZ